MGEEVIDVGLGDALSERYLTYALSTIVARSLPDVRDGLKPVHRRLLFAMRALQLDPEATFKKCARVVGDVIGKFHPHGDTAVYEALVRLVQDFAARYPLVEGQGNFGNIDGDNPAAMRYTEVRLTAVAQSLMDGLEDDTVDFRPTYDSEEREPVVMPAAFPNLLANGATGIAVGMATSIPPHNVGELCDALLSLIRKPGGDVADLMRLVHGPDFPTGGVLVEKAEILLEAYRTGRGSLRLRARWEVERLPHGLYQVVITEIPYQVQKAKLIERIADLLAERRLPFLADVRDESTDTVRIVLEPRSRTVSPDHLMEQLFHTTDLESRIMLNMNVLGADGVPRVMNLKQILKDFLDHRYVVLERRTRHRLGRIASHLEVLEGYLKAYLNLDEIICIIREESDPKTALRTAFTLTYRQAEAIFNMRLHNLHQLEEKSIHSEYANLSAEKAALERLLAEPAVRWQHISEEIRKVRHKFGTTTRLGRRRTEIGPAATTAVESPWEACESITVVLSKKGWLRAVKGYADAGLKFKEGDALRFAIQATTADRLLLFTSNGLFYTLAAGRLPRGRSFGEPLRLSINLANDADVVALFVHDPDHRLLLVSHFGRGFIVEESGILAQTRNGKRIMEVGEADTARFCLPITGDTVALLSETRHLLILRVNDVPVVGKGRGASLQKSHDAAGLTDVRIFTMAQGLSFSSGGQVMVEKNLAPWLGQCGQSGHLLPPGFHEIIPPYVA